MRNVPPSVDALIALALEEDLGRGDLTTACVLLGDGGPARAVFLAKQSLVVFGLEVVRRVFLRVDETVRFSPRVSDGAYVEHGVILAEVFGPADALLAAERTALNFLQRLSGVATLSRRF